MLSERSLRELTTAFGNSEAGGNRSGGIVVGQVQRISKILSRNDLGLTGSHQAGITVPRNPEFLAIFPKLDPLIKNPEAKVWVIAEEIEYAGHLRFIYYNGKLLGEGTRNEYRLTGATQLLRGLQAMPGDELHFERRQTQDLHLELIRQSRAFEEAKEREKSPGGWRIIRRENV